MVAAPVGFQCTECVGQAAKTAPVHTAQSAFRQSLGKPYVTYAIIGICVFAFGVEFLLGVSSVASDFAMRPIYIAFGGQWYRLITSVFLHWSILHIAFNMLVLFMIGPALERVLGHVRFAALFLIAGLGGAVASYCFSSVATTSVGASGAVFGLMGALIVAGRKLRYDVTQVVVLLAINLAIGFIPGSSIDWRAHLGGLIVGALVALIFTRAPKKGAAAFQIVGCLAVLVILAGMVGWRTTQIEDEFALREQTPLAASANASGTLDSERINDRS